MSTTIIRKLVKDTGGVLVDPSSIVFEDPTGAYGVKRTDTDAVVVAAGTALTKVSTGVYEYPITDPADDLTYAYYVKFVYDGETYSVAGSQAGGSSSSGNLYDLKGRVWSEVSGAPEALVQQALRWAARYFCSLTEVLEIEPAAVASVADETDYSLVLGYDAAVQRLLWCKLDGVEVSANLEADGTLALVTAPTASGLDITTRVALLPCQGMTTYPAWFLTRWADGVVEWAKFRLKSMQGVPWSDGAGAALAQALANEQIGKARGELVTTRTSGPVTVTRAKFV